MSKIICKKNQFARWEDVPGEVYPLTRKGKEIIEGRKYALKALHPDYLYHIVMV